MAHSDLIKDFILIAISIVILVGFVGFIATSTADAANNANLSTLAKFLIVLVPTLFVLGLVYYLLKHMLK